MDDPLTLGDFLLWLFVYLPLACILLYLAIVVALHSLVGGMHLSDRVHDWWQRRADRKIARLMEEDNGE